MGGVAGHMDHLYDNRDLSFGEMKDILKAASNGELTAEEKVDGQNLFLSYSVPEGKAKGARNKGNLKSGGLDAASLSQKFAGRQGLHEAFTGGFTAFEKAIEALSEEEKKRIFGPNTNIWYNAEVMDPGSRNVILYDDKTLKIHNVGHFIFDRDTGEKTPIPEGTLETLDNAFERMKDRLYGDDFNLARQAMINLQKLEDDQALRIAVSQIDNQLRQEGLSDESTVLDYLIKRLTKGIETDLPDNVKEELINYILMLPSNIGLRAIKQGMNPQEKNEVTSIIDGKRSLLQQAIEPLEMIVHNFTVEILKGLKSIFIADNQKEVQRLKSELSSAVNHITSVGAENPQAMSVMQRHLNKIKDFSRVTTPIEAVVFDYNGHTYKFAGNFAPINQILGMFRYGNLKKKTNESLNAKAEVITEKSGKRVALLPGGFKPPHAGHYGLAKELSSLPDIDEVVVIIGKKPRFSEIEPEVAISAEQSKNLWDIYTRNNENIKVIIQKGKTPVADVYDLIADKNSFSEGDTVILGKSDKDVGDKRYARAQSYAEMNNPGVNVEEMIFPVTGGENMGGTALRNMIAAGEKEKFMSKLPSHLNKSDLEAAWDIVSPLPVEGLDKLIDTTLAEISSMAAGSVEGANKSSSWGHPNTYNVFNKNTNSRRRPKKPTVKRAKRQRRR